ncbi:Alkaline phosphatase synthesis sensor protein PhoR [Acaryochloris thomasi RCC1774]|uniref:histidine kinase n=1 Tax=Acaryochloris thomasi RCC1774 TaxID=1764569 RepID=A0A2W1JCU6_9CYAN|nr:HAMP domain-containing sensor histidine kinase [Acaryochloris thomasi]PZD71618.1 Alkaline phosphatase synthesis sensor protein PhoR [Acaryochloris thomasi RCC1774]
MTVFKDLGWRLLATYWLVMTAILGTSALAIYLRFVHVVNAQLDARLTTLAESGRPSLVALKSEGQDALLRQEMQWPRLLHRDQQGLTWYNDRKISLLDQGTVFVDLPPDTGANPGRSIILSPNTRSVLLAVPSATNAGQIEGYVLATESTHRVERLIRQLRLGLGIGGLVALSLSSLGGMLLAHRTLEPTQRSYKKLKQFTADASHELRSPLTAIKFSLDVLMKHPERIHPKNTRKISAISSATDQMITLVEDLLFLARSEVAADTQDTSKETQTSIYKILQGLLTLLEPQAQSKTITFESVLIPDVTILGDEAKLTRLFSNLLDNALQYTPAGGSVKVRMEKSVKSVFITFEDTGIGIAPSQIRSVFRRLWRTDRARNRRDGGVGLGLSIAQAIAQQHNGKITVSSRIGVGSCFRVRLPLAKASVEQFEMTAIPLDRRRTADQPLRG